jgi:hypothetical protein
MNGYGRRTCQCFMPGKDEEFLEMAAACPAVGSGASAPSATGWHHVAKMGERVTVAQLH